VLGCRQRLPSLSLHLPRSSSRSRPRPCLETTVRIREERSKMKQHIWYNTVVFVQLRNRDMLSHVSAHPGPSTCYALPSKEPRLQPCGPVLKKSLQYLDSFQCVMTHASVLPSIEFSSAGSPFCRSVALDWAGGETWSYGVMAFFDGCWRV